ncbi:MAG: hypothetical protein LC624_05225 [Halobacteriales archaeon]|nr:hypothetical protein [Halobacteriales archaeon]
MRLPTLLVALLCLPVAAALPSLQAPAPTAVPAGYAPPVDLLPAEVAARVHGVFDQGTWIGKTPGAWLGWAQQQVAPQAERGPGADLVPAVERVYDAVGAQASPAQVAQLAARADALDPRVAAAFAPLVAVVAQAYAEQALVPAQLDFSSPTGQFLPLDAAAASVARGARVLAAVSAFRADVAALQLQADVPGFADPLGLVVLGGTAADTFVPDGLLADPVLLADLGGDDVDLTSSGGACPLTVQNNWATCNGLALSVRVDLAGNDVYHSVGDRQVAQGAGGFGGLGILVDEAGNDQYVIDDHVTQGSFLQYYITGSSQGAGEAGVGFLVDAAGNDQYRFNLDSHGDDAFAQGQGYGGVGGFGMLLDAGGNDLYDTEVRCDNGVAASNTFCGLYTDAVALYPGVAILLDLGGDDVTHAVDVAPDEDYYAQSFAAFGGLTIQVDASGNDVYYASATSTQGGPELNCAYGTAEYAGALAIFIDGAGADSYYDETVSPSGGPSTMAEGFSVASGSLFWDVSGVDVHSMAAFGNSPLISGRGSVEPGRGPGYGVTETYGIYLDTGGADTYYDVDGTPNRVVTHIATIGGNDRNWGGVPQYFGGTDLRNFYGIGIDRNLVPG